MPAVPTTGIMPCPASAPAGWFARAAVFYRHVCYFPRLPKPATLWDRTTKHDGSLACVNNRLWLGQIRRDLRPGRSCIEQTDTGANALPFSFTVPTRGAVTV